MSSFTRRRFLAATSIAAAVGATRQLTGPQAAHAAELKLVPEKGAVLRVLRWKRFVQGDEEVFMANTHRYTQQTGVEVKVDSENWEDLRPKAAVARGVRGLGSRAGERRHDDLQHQPPERRHQPLGAGAHHRR